MTSEHTPVLCKELIGLMVTGQPQGVIDGGVFVDATFGRGGHSRALLKALGTNAKLVVIDRDDRAIEVAEQLAREDQRVVARHARFSRLSTVLGEFACQDVNGVIMDLGVSSPQLDDASRGFSFRSRAPLDMRMDQSSELTAEIWLNETDEREIARVLREYGEERYARRIARAIVAARPLSTTFDLVSAVSAAGRPTPGRSSGRHDATRVFQAVRIRVNDELGELEQGLAAAFECLCAGGRLAVISFHSLEDRMVKRYFRSLSRPADAPRRLPLRHKDLHVRGRSLGSPIRPGVSEVRRNPRARSAILRAVERAA